MSLESRLCDLFGFTRCVFFGRGRSGLAAVVRVLGGPPVVGPSNACPAVVYAALAGGGTYLPVAVGPRNGLVNFHEAVIRNAVAMPTHLYGEHVNTDDMKADYVLENDTLAVTVDRAFRAVGDALLVSFAHGKTIDAGGGGAILTDSDELERDLKIVKSEWLGWTDKDTRIDMECTALRRHGTSAEAMLKTELEAVGRNCHNISYKKLEHALNVRIHKIEKMRSRWLCWQSNLSYFELLEERDPPPVPWRFTVHMDCKKNRDAVVKALRAEGYDAGTNYPNLCRSFPRLLGEYHAADADTWADTVLNFWLTEDYPDERIHKAAGTIRRVYDELMAKA